MIDYATLTAAAIPGSPPQSQGRSRAEQAEGVNFAEMLRMSKANPQTGQAGKTAHQALTRREADRTESAPETGPADAERPLRSRRETQMRTEPPDAPPVSAEEAKTEEPAEAAEAAAVIAPPPAPVPPPAEASKESEPQLEVNGVVFPPGWKSQDELRVLIAQILGAEEDGGFSVVWEALLPEDGTRLDTPEDVRKLLARMIQGLESPEADTPEFTDILAEFLTAVTGAVQSQGGGQETVQSPRQDFLVLRMQTLTAPDILKQELTPQDTMARLLEALGASEIKLTAAPDTAAGAAPDAEAGSLPAEAAAETAETEDAAPPPKAPAAPEARAAETPEIKSSASPVRAAEAAPPDTEPDAAEGEVNTPKAVTANQNTEEAQGPIRMPEQTEEEAAVTAAKDTPQAVKSEGHAAAPAAEARAPAPVNTAPVQGTQAPSAASVIEQIARYAQSAGREANTLEMQLNPATLGKLTLVVHRTQEGMTATLKSPSDTVRNLLSGHLPELQTALKDMGINMKSIQIEQPDISWDLTRQDFGQGARSQDGRQSAYDSRPRMRGIGRASRTAAYPEAPPPVSAGYIYGTSALQPAWAGEASLDLKA